jgi:hypothetical protein
MVSMRTTVVILLISSAAALFAATGDVPLSPVLKAPLPSIADIAIATSGTEYLLVYSRARRIYWQRISVEGTAIDPEARLLEGAVLGQGFGDDIEVVWTGERYLLLWNQDNVVVAQGIDREGVVGNRLTLVSGMTLRDAARRGNEVAVLSSGTGWRLSLLNPYGTPLGGWSFASSASVLQIVRLDEGWTLVDAAGLTVLNPQSGTSRVVAPGALFEKVVAAPDGGALAIRADGSVAVLRRDGSLVPLSLADSFERLSLYRAALISPSPSGWTLFYRAGGAMRIASVTAQGTIASDRILEGPFPLLDGRYYYGLEAASARDGNHLLLQPAAIGTVLGLESIAVAGNAAYATAAYAVFDAVQQWGRTAHAPGLDLVAWLEAGDRGWDIRATRVQDGAPLDEEGLVLGSGFPASLAVAYDGETFAVAWSDRDGIFLRRVDLLGNLPDSAPLLVSTAAAVEVTAAGSGDGGLLLSWPRPRPTVAYVRGGRVRSTAFVGSDDTGDRLETGGSRPSYLVTFAYLPPPCQLGPCEIDFKPVAVQLVGPSGAASGGPVAITDPAPAIAGKPVSHGGEWFVPIVLFTGDPNEPYIPRVVRLTGSATSSIGSVRTVEGKLRSMTGGLEILGTTFRGMLSSDPENLWFEPLPLEDGDAAEGVLPASPALLVNTGTRFVVRPHSSPTLSADIAVVYTGRSSSGPLVSHTVRIEHRGGDDVPALYVDVRPAHHLEVTSSRPIVDGRIDGPFKPGEAIELVIRGNLRPFVTALPFARETAAADNFLLVDEEAPPPPPARRRLVGRP